MPFCSPTRPLTNDIPHSHDDRDRGGCSRRAYFRGGLIGAEISRNFSSFLINDANERKKERKKEKKKEKE